MSDQTQKPIEEIRNEKIKKIEALKQQGIEVFSSSTKFGLITIDEAKEAALDSVVSIAGRIKSIRGHGKIRFVDIEDYSGKIQASVKFDTVGQDKFEVFRLIDPGDFIEVTGQLFNTNAGELTLNIGDFNILSKVIRPLPDSREGFNDKELRLRKRYLDLLINEETQLVFNIRHMLTREIRRFLDNKGLVEVETPVLQPLYGGANAKPFTTQINALGANAYLRIASELYLKRLMVTNTKGVYDIAKDFRNEGIDQTHYPEFTMMEAYLAYADYHKIMDLMEEMVKNLASVILNSHQLQVGETTININQTWNRTPMTDLICDQFGIQNLEFETLKSIAVQHKLEIMPNTSTGELTFLIFDKLITPKLIAPIWVIDYPVEISPLAKDHRSKPGFVERFELYVGGKEIMDGWSEINNPLVQRNRFEAEQKRSFDTTESAQPIDEDYLEAMEYGMPPMAGVGTGIDRLTMLFSNHWSIQETILFPFKKPE